jgi:hypothetical protein
MTLALTGEGAERLTLVEPERGDINETCHVGRVLAEGCHDLAAVRVSRHDCRAVLARENLAEPCDVVR